ncbi:MAG: YicC/YloC family endoribonuclease [Bosea sp. (in: a-proteobacteria)]|uniref:YicC/YloC family endoribonuclease n=1 Tax=unclassified Bosea (in: a-proteobacteria) TaxID=2653178 RepID=UPI000961B24F|nr:MULTISPECIES: YicC/YloC family endoribonuclease [unclassified Bosea (in: a-proteobacteria)]MBN9443158.1 YicC family protein [Bosea sp. (in: a-proteobacteria)]MBN9457159.1 YicC family protein [Bosea sp. (in: a-proteobacteria)]OJV09826.1 MAG: YicC family protein [Bosea sp. 67-29]
MGIESMTGFARAAGTTGVHGWAWEIRSVNGRGLDVRVRVPPGLEILAEAARKRLSGAFARGTLHVNLAVTSDAGPPRPRVNETVLAALLAAIEALPASGIDRPTFDGLLAVRGVVEYADEAQDVLGAVEKPALAGLEAAVEALQEARADEGRALEAIVLGHVETISRLASEAEHHPARRSEAIRARIAAQVEALLGSANGLDPQRLHQEAALIAVRADIREEIDRLHAHVAALRELLAKGGPIGRKLDFLAQEFGREASTLCAKANDPDLSRIGLDLRTVVDQMREQVQNVE